MAQRWKHVGREAHALRTLGEVSLSAGAHRDAVSHYEHALPIAEERGMRPLVAHCHRGLAEGHRQAGRDDLAGQHREIAQSMYEAMGMRYWLPT